MEFCEDAMVTIGKFTGECDIYFEDVERRFRIVRKPSSSGAGTAVRVMFGMIGQAIMNKVGTGEEIATFTPADIREVEVVEKKRKSIFSIYPYSGDGPYVITAGNKSELYAHLNRELVANRNNAGNQEPVIRTAIPPEVLQEIAPEPAAPVAPVQPVQPVAPVQPIQPVAPVQPIQPVAPVQPVQPVAPVQPVQSVALVQPIQPMPPVQPQSHMQQPARQPAQQPAQPRGNGALLCLRSGPMAGRIYPYPVGTVLVIGRSAARSNLALAQYEKVSSAHCRVEIGNRCLRVTDLNSTNGTFANGAPVQPNQPVILREGDMLMLGNEACVFRIAFE